MHRKPVFDTVRRLLGRGFRKSEIAALDKAIDEAMQVGDLPSQDTVTGVTCPRPTTASDVAVALIKEFEGFARVRPDGLVEAYPDPGTGGAPWTIGWGATGGGIARGTIWSRAQCEERLAADVARHAAEVSDALVEAPTSQAQFDALVSFHYNTGAIRRATLTSLHRAGNYGAAANEFARWNRAGGRVMPGLVRRRAAEADLYRS